MSSRSAEQSAASGRKPRYGLRVLGLALLGTGLTAACLPWSVSSPRLVAVVADELARTYGIALSVEGATEIALLPFPRLRFAQARLASGSPGGAVLAEGGHLSLQFSLIALGAGRIDLDALSLDGAAVTLPQAAADRRWAEPAQRLFRRTGSVAPPPRLNLTRATMTGWDPRDGTIQTVHNVDLGLSTPLWGGSAELSARGTWKRGEGRLRIKNLDLAALSGGGSSPFSAAAEWPSGTLVAKGSGNFGEVWEAEGQVLLTTRSLPETLAWTGGGIALAPLIEAAAVEADFKTTAKDLQLPQVRLTLGSNRLEGAGSISFADERPAIQATLAAESLNVAPLLGELIHALGLDPSAASASGWARRRLALGPFTAGDLDLRLSAASARVGPVLVEDIASSLIVREGMIEASIGRAGLRGGTVKGRIILGRMPDRRDTEIRAQGTFDGLDLGALLIDVGEVRWLAGAVNGTFAVESRAATMGDLAAGLGGRASVAVEGGALTGLDLAAVMRRGRDDPAGQPVQRIGRTDFVRAGFALRLKDGIGTITEGTLAAPDLTASLAGTLSLPARRVDARAELAPSSGGQGQTRLFEIAGPLNAVAVRPAALRRQDGDPGGLAVMKPDRRVPATGGVPPAARAYAP